jgi:hypothetical protein
VDSLCPVLQCYTSKVFHDMESLRNRIYSDLNQVSELQGDVNCTFNRIPFIVRWIWASPSPPSRTSFEI